MRTKELSHRTGGRPVAGRRELASFGKDPVMTQRSIIRLAAVLFALALAIHFAVPPPAAAACSCSAPVHQTPTETGSGATCTAAQNNLNVQLLRQETACATDDPCDSTQTITAPCTQVGTTFQIQGYDKYLCLVGTTCP
jgi:hypothetical protein